MQFHGSFDNVPVGEKEKTIHMNTTNLIGLKFLKSNTFKENFEQ